MDEKAAKFTITLKDGKDKTFKVDAKKGILGSERWRPWNGAEGVDG